MTSPRQPRSGHRIGGGIRVVEQGDGPPLLLLHGIHSSAESFDRQLDDLGRRWRCLAWDAPGYGRSDDPPQPLDMDDFADAAFRVLVDLDARPAHVLGISWGGVVAVRLALRHPDAVASLVLANSNRGAGVSAEGQAAMRRRPQDLEEVGIQQFTTRGAPRALSPTAPQELVEAVAAAARDAIRLPGYRFATSAFADTDHTDVLGELEVPTLVLAGDEDQIAFRESAELAARIPGAQYHVISGAGHLSNQERPDEFARLVSEFLRSTQPEG